jgi:hypothetical protein
MNGWKSSRVAIATALVLMLTATMAARRNARAPQEPAGQNVELFSAIEKGQLEVKVIPKDATQMRVMLTNKTDQPLSVKLPDAIAAVPVLAQGINPPGGGRQNNNNNQNQGMGGAFGGGGMGGGGMGGGLMNIAPEKVGQLKANTVCLEYGKEDPRPGVNYKLTPIEQFTSKPEVHELCKRLAAGTHNQRVAQLAAWHFNNGMTWEQLAKIEYKIAGGGRTPQYSAQEIQAAMQLSAVVTQIAEQKKQQQPTPSTSSSVTN